MAAHDREAVAFVAERDDDSVAVVDLAQRRVRARVRVGTHPFALLHDAARQRVYARNVQSDDVSVISVADLDAPVIHVVDMPTPCEPVDPGMGISAVQAVCSAIHPDSRCAHLQGYMTDADDWYCTIACNPFDNVGWATNWNVRSYGVNLSGLQTTPTRGGTKSPNLFSDPTAAYQSFRSPYAGETGDRNQLRYPGFVSLDFGLYKVFKMPYNEGHKLQFRWEVFNLTNSVRFDPRNVNLALSAAVAVPELYAGERLALEFTRTDRKSVV